MAEAKQHKVHEHLSINFINCSDSKQSGLEGELARHLDDVDSQKD